MAINTPKQSKPPTLSTTKPMVVRMRKYLEAMDPSAMMEDDAFEAERAGRALDGLHGFVSGDPVLKAYFAEMVTVLDEMREFIEANAE